MNNKAIKALAAASLMVLVACNSTRVSTTSDDLSRLPERGRALATHSPGATFWTNAYSMFVTLDETAKRVQLRGVEEDPTTGTVHYWDKAFAVSYTPTAAAFRHGSEFYVAGTTSTGATIVERWDIPHVPGMYYSALPIASGAAIGVPIVTSAVRIAIEGGTFIDPAARAAPTAIRSVVYTGTNVGPIAGMEIDPDARFLLVTELTSEWRLVQIRLEPAPTVHIMATQTQFPNLVGATGARPIDNSLAGRMYMLTTRLGGTIWVEDPTNDGILDSVNELDGRAFDTAFPAHTWSQVHY